MRITKAVDDLGNSLARDRSSFFGDGMEVIDRDSRFGPERPDDETSVRVNLDSSVQDDRLSL